MEIMKFIQTIDLNELIIFCQKLGVSKEKLFEVLDFPELLYFFS